VGTDFDRKMKYAMMLELGLDALWIASQLQIRIIAQEKIQQQTLAAY